MRSSEPREAQYRHEDDGGGAVVWTFGLVALASMSTAALLLWWAL